MLPLEQITLTPGTAPWHDDVLIRSALSQGWTLEPYKGRKPEPPKGKCRPILYAQYGQKSSVGYSKCRSHWDSPAEMMQKALVLPDKISFTGACVYDEKEEEEV